MECRFQRQANESADVEGRGEKEKEREEVHPNFVGGERVLASQMRLIDEQEVVRRVREIVRGYVKSEGDDERERSETTGMETNALDEGPSPPHLSSSLDADQKLSDTTSNAKITKPLRTTCNALPNPNTNSKPTLQLQIAIEVVPTQKKPKIRTGGNRTKALPALPSNSGSKLCFGIRDSGDAGGTLPPYTSSSASCSLSRSFEPSLLSPCSPISSSPSPVSPTSDTTPSSYSPHKPSPSSRTKSTPPKVAWYANDEVEGLERSTCAARSVRSMRLGGGVGGDRDAKNVRALQSAGGSVSVGSMRMGEERVGRSVVRARFGDEWSVRSRPGKLNAGSSVATQAWRQLSVSINSNPDVNINAKTKTRFYPRASESTSSPTSRAPSPTRSLAPSLSHTRMMLERSWTQTGDEGMEREMCQRGYSSESEGKRGLRKKRGGTGKGRERDKEDPMKVLGLMGDRKEGGLGRGILGSLRFRRREV